MGSDFVPLAGHSCFSLLDSPLTPQELVEIAHRHGYSAVGLTDRNSLAGAIPFARAARAAGLQPIIGSEVSVAGGSRLTLLVENEAGYRNLCRLLTTLMDHPGGVERDDLARYAAGLICLMGPASDGACDLWREIYGRNLAFAPGLHHADDERQARVMMNVSRRLRIPAAALPQIHYAHADDRLMYDILSSMRTLTLLEREHPDKLPAGHYHFLTPAEVARRYADMPQAIANTRAIAERCQFSFALGDIHFPRYAPDEEAIALLRQMAEDGLRTRYGANPSREAWERLHRELEVIIDVGYAGYFLIFADIVRWANARGIATLARGSAAGSLVCYTLGIGNVCPFRFNLCFERFLNRERMQFSKLADIDLDLPWDQRDEVIAYVFDRYGGRQANVDAQVAMIGAYNTFQGRSALADIAKVYGLPEREVRRFTDRLPHFSGDPLALITQSPECRDLPVNMEPWKTILRLSSRFDGLPRHASMHPCGLVISASPLTQHLPLFRSAKGHFTTQYAMDEVEELGLLKMDLLGQAGLSVLREARETIQRETGRAPDAVDEQDATTWDAIAHGETRGVFHIESPNMVNLLIMSNCRDINCLTALESVIRPGAANEGRKRAFARRHQGLEPISYAHPSLEPLLSDSYGLLIYEEHILLVATGFAGMAHGRADTLRRLLVKNRDAARIDALGEEFRVAARQRGHHAEDIERVWGMLREFAGYMFNKAHSAAYAVEAFEGAFLKMRYPLALLSAVLTCRRGFYTPLVYVLEALRHGARLLPPCLQASHPSRFQLQGTEIRLPLNQVRGLSDETLARIEQQRPFADVSDFFRRVRPRQNEWLALLKTDALQTLDPARGRLFWRLSRLQSYAPKTQAPSLFAAEDNPLAAPEEAPTLLRRCLDEAELLGFPVSAHPLDVYAPGMAWSQYTPACELLAHPERFFGRTVHIAGMIVADRLHPTERGTMKFITLADPTGFMEVSLFPETYQQYGHLTTRPVLTLTALAEPFDNQLGVQLTAQRVAAHAA
jgi:DNA-directed DNA polymerase III PolC